MELSFDKYEKPSDLGNLAMNNWQFPKHLQLIESKILDTLNNEKNGLIVNMPPRHGKTEYISRIFPTWFLLNNPDKRIILTTYSTEYAAILGKRVKDFIEEIGIEKGVKLSPSGRSNRNFSFDSHKGGLSSVGSLGSLTGKGADILIIDDPIKNDKDARSFNKRESLWDWFKATAFTRLEPDGKVLVVMTRWHEDDLVGRLVAMEDDGMKWDLLTLPAIAEHNDELGRKVGEALWEVRFSADKLNKIRKMVGEYWFSALYQQQPSPMGGGVFKRENFVYYEKNGDSFRIFHKDKEIEIIHKHQLRIFATFDLATSTKNSADYTAGVVFGIDYLGRILVLDVIRKKIEGAEHLNLLKSVNYQWQPVLIGLEAVQYQLSLVQMARKEGLPIKALIPDRDKFSRALPLAAMFERGEVYFQRNSIWLDDLEKELLMFPNAAHDDQVDALAYSTTMAYKSSSLMPVSIKKEIGNRYRF